MIESDVHIQEKTAKAEKTKKSNEQNYQFYLRHRQCVKYYLHSENENLFIKFVSNFVNSFSIFRRSTQFKI